jgi:hypothetical protein
MPADPERKKETQRLDYYEVDRRCDRMMYGSIGVLLCVAIVVGVALWGCR